MGRRRWRARLIVMAALAVLALVFGPKRLGWLVPGPDGAVTDYVMHELFSGNGIHDPTGEGLEELRAVLDDTWVLWWRVSSSIPIRDREDHPFWLGIYVKERILAIAFYLGFDGLLYEGKLRFRPLNANLPATLEPLAEQWEREHKNGGDGWVTSSICNRLIQSLDNLRIHPDGIGAPTKRRPLSRSGCD